MGELEVLSRTQRIVVENHSAEVIVDQIRPIKIVNSGTVGPRGFPGLALSNVSYRHTQTVQLYVWLVVHNLGYKPAGIKAYEQVGPDEYVEVEGEINYLNDNMFTIQFNASLLGYVLVS